MFPYNSYQNFPEGSCMKVFVTQKPCSDSNCFSQSVGNVVLKDLLVSINRVDYTLKFDGKPGKYYVS